MALALNVAPAQAAPNPNCPPITELHFEDRILGMSVDYSAADRTLTFNTADGRPLEGARARLIGKRKIQIHSRSITLSVSLKADLTTGMAEAVAVERDVHPDNPTAQGAARTFHRLFVPSSRQNPPIQPCRAPPRR